MRIKKREEKIHEVNDKRFIILCAFFILFLTPITVSLIQSLIPLI
jgi:hypothetical protein